MNSRTQNRVFAAFGIGSVVLMFAGLGIGSIGSTTRNLTISSSPAHVAHAFSKTAGTSAWIGAYVELLSFGLFLAFAVWACERLGGGVVGQVARAAATAFATVSIVSLGVMDAASYRSGKGVGTQLGSALVTINEALYVCTWFLAAFFLVAAGALAVAAGRRALGRSAIAVAAIMLVLTAVSVDNFGQMAFTLWIAWIVYASIALARDVPRRSTATAVARTA
jgi:hypothetical protein